MALLYSFPNLELVHSSITGSNCWILTFIQVSQEAGTMIWYTNLENFPQFVVIHTVKGFSVVNEAEVDVFLESPCFLHDPRNIGNLISGSSASLKPILYIWKFTFHMLLKSSLKHLSITFLVCEMIAAVQ